MPKKEKTIVKKNNRYKTIVALKLFLINCAPKIICKAKKQETIAKINPRFTIPVSLFINKV